MAKNIQGAAAGAANSFLASSTSVTTVNNAVVESQEVQHFVMGSIVDGDQFKQNSAQFPLQVKPPIVPHRRFDSNEDTIASFVTASRLLGCKTLRIYYQQFVPTASGTLDLVIGGYSPPISLVLASFGLLGEEASAGPWGFIDLYLDPNITNVLANGPSLNLHIIAF